MTIIEAFILGIIQGLTEFLPISSSGHLVLSQVILGIQIPGNDFEVLLHIGTLCSILVVFNNDIKNILFTLSSKETQKFILMIFVGTIPAVIVGLGFKDVIERLFDDIIVVGFALVFTGITLIGSFYSKSGNKKNTIFKACLIGVAQAIAIIPGISRSGITISFALFLGLDTRQAAKFSFLLAIPVISGAGILMATDLRDGFSIDIYTASSGLITSFFVGMVALKWLLSWLEAGKFHYFGIYCFLIGIFIVIS
ncbi:MAG: undecaprenyl-diphosphate phosphatase [Candidatus Neomarinimicrobiota bacterium]